MFNSLGDILRKARRDMLNKLKEILEKVLRRVKRLSGIELEENLEDVVSALSETIRRQRQKDGQRPIDPISGDYIID